MQKEINEIKGGIIKEETWRKEVPKLKTEIPVQKNKYE
jgi:hypothetical protein